jgi:hypothetical protein
MSRIIRKRVVRTLPALGLAAIAALAVSASVAAAPTLLSPAPGAVVKSTHPVFKWNLPSNEHPVVISIATGPQTQDSGEFARQNQVQLDILDGTVNEWSPDRALPAGKYYWHVSSRIAETGELAFSPVAPFTIPVVVKIEPVALQTYPGQHVVLATVRWTANVRTTVMTVRLLKGSAQLLTTTATKDNFLIDSATQQLVPLTIPATVKSGARLRLVVTVTVKGTTVKATMSKVLRAP